MAQGATSLRMLAWRLASSRRGRLNRVLTYPPGILARGPWGPDRVTSHWNDTPHEPPPAQAAAADRAIAELRGRGSPSHDGVGARLASFEVVEGELRLELEEMRWALRLLDDAANALSVLCAVRDHEGRWLAGRRAAWVASWAGVWALGAGGAVDAREDPALALGRELVEEWGVEPERIAVEALIVATDGLALLIGQAWLAPGAEVTRDHEHDAHAWWPPDPADWPEESHPQLRRMASLVLQDT
jgi:8-oxo-dGTP diphosphatase